jgi:hypothetical protein
MPPLFQINYGVLLGGHHICTVTDVSSTTYVTAK